MLRVQYGYPNICECCKKKQKDIYVIRERSEEGSGEPKLRICKPCFAFLIREAGKIKFKEG